MTSLQVGVVGHWRANIGHDLMALGVERVLGLAFGEGVRVVRIEHHRPLDVYPWWFLPRHLPSLRHGRGGRVARSVKAYINRPEVSRRLWPASWVGRLDLAIVCGGPLITPWVSQGDLGLMYQHMFGAFHTNGVPVLDLSVGAAYPREGMADARITEQDALFLERMFAYSAVTTVRDTLAQRLCEHLGFDVRLVADTGFVSGAMLSAMAPAGGGDRYVVLNAQRYGANEDWGQGVDPERWSSTLSELARRVARHTEVLFVCHSEVEMRNAERIAPSARRIRPRTPKEYARVVSCAVAGICTRIHSGIALASVGVPSVGIGTDSRLLTLETLGLRTHYVKDVDVDLLEAELDRVLGCADEEHRRLLDLRAVTEDQYVQILQRAVP